MNYFDIYKKRVTSNGSTIAESYTNSSKDLINHTFEDSPTYAHIDIGGDMYDVRITNEDKDDEKTLLFRPDVEIPLGLYATINNDKWLILEYDKNVTTPTSLIKKANRTLKWSNTYGDIFSEPCVIESVLYEEQRDGKYFFSPKGNMRVYTQLNEFTKTLYTEQRFIFGSSIYKIGGLDNFTYVFNNVGYITLNLEKTVKNVHDDFELGIAWNDVTLIPDADNSEQGGNGGGGWLD